MTAKTRLVTYEMRKISVNDFIWALTVDRVTGTRTSHKTSHCKRRLKALYYGPHPGVKR